MAAVVKRTRTRFQVRGRGHRRRALCNCPPVPPKRRREQQDLIDHAAESQTRRSFGVAPRSLAAFKRDRQPRGFSSWGSE